MTPQFGLSSPPSPSRCRGELVVTETKRAEWWTQKCAAVRDRRAPFGRVHEPTWRSFNPSTAVSLPGAASAMPTIIAGRSQKNCMAYSRLNSVAKLQWRSRIIAQEVMIAIVDDKRKGLRVEWEKSEGLFRLNKLAQYTALWIILQDWSGSKLSKPMQYSTTSSLWTNSQIPQI